MLNLMPLDPSSLGIRLGGKERATGVYKDIHEDCERHSQQRRKPKCEGYNRHNLSWLLIALAVLALDQLSKFLVAYNLYMELPVRVTSFFNLYFTYNTGAAFSFLENAQGWQIWIFGGIAFFVSLAILHWLWHAGPRKMLMKCSLMLILGGAVGNLIDRIAYGHVRDFIDIYWQVWHWPTFNLADSAICVGAFLLIFELLNRPTSD